MASISSLTGSNNNVSSIFANRNVISGLSSGLDTEALIENSVLGYKTKIQNLLKQQTKLSWKQDAYRKITDQLINLSQKYTSYTSKTNLSSPSFFNNAVKTITGGTNADKVSAAGKSSSEIQIDSVKQLATAARYAIAVDETKFGMSTSKAIGKEIKLNDDGKTITKSAVSGSLTLNVDSKKVELTFGEKDIFTDGDGTTAAEKFLAAVKDQLTDTGINAELKDGSIAFSSANGAAVWISGASGDIQSAFDIKSSSANSASASRSFSVEGKDFTKKQNLADALKGDTISVTLDGTTRRIELSKLSGEGDVRQNLVDLLNNSLKDGFGNKVTAEMGDNGELVFKTTNQNSTLRVASSAGGLLGIGSGIGNYLDMGKKLGDVVDEEKWDTFTPLKTTDKDGNEVLDQDENGNQRYGLVINGKVVGGFTKDSALESVLSAINSSDAGVRVSYSQLTNKFTFTATETGAQGRIDFGEGLASDLFLPGDNSDKYNTTGEHDTGILMDISGKKVAAGMFEDDNGNAQPYYIKRTVTRINAETSITTYQMVNEHGANLGNGTKLLGGEDSVVEKNGRLSESDSRVVDSLKKARVGFTAGTDAILSATVNGEKVDLVRSSNTLDIDGLNVTLKDTFNEDGVVPAGSAVTFSTKADADPIVDAIKSFVDDLNQIMKDTHEAYTTTYTKTSSGNRLEPLTDEEKAKMSETQIKEYEDKAKQGLLFCDSDLSRLYSSLRSVISATGDTRKAMESIGITTQYEDGVTTLSLDENRLRAALENNPDAVQKVFTDSTSNNATKQGLMSRVKSTLDRYASTSIGNYGVLVRKAGTKMKSLTLLDNELQKQMNSLDKQIDRWQNKMNDKVDYYSRQFTMLEKLMEQMNSQSSALAGMLGY